MKILLLLASVALSITTSAQILQLKNRDVANLSKAGLSPEAIIAKIKHSDCKFQTDPQNLLDLKKEGVDNDVIRAMIECGDATSESGISITTTTQVPTTGALVIQAGIVYKIGAPQPVARTDFVILDDDPVKILSDAGIPGKKPPLGPRMDILQSFLFMNMGNRWNDGERALAILKRHVIATGTTDFNGTLAFPELPANRKVYLFGIAQTRGGWAVWDLWYEIAPGRTLTGILDQKNAAIIF